MVSTAKLRLADVIPESNIVPALKATKKEAAIRELVNVLASAGAIPKSRVREVTDAVVAREKLGSTGIGRGIAVPHEKMDFIREPVGAFGKTAAGLDFSSLDGAPTFSVFLFLSPAEPPDRHIALMSRFVTLIRKPDFVSFLAQTQGAKALHEFLREVDEW